MKRPVNGTLVDIPTEPDGRVDSDKLRQEAKIPLDRAMILHRPDGRNDVVNPHEVIVVGEYDSFSPKFQHL